MTTTLTQESKHSLSITNEAKGGGDITEDEATFTWDEAVRTWDEPSVVLTKEAKHNLTITNEAKT